MLDVSVEYKNAIKSPSRQTGLEVSFGIFDVTAKTDATITVNQKQTFVEEYELVDNIKSNPKLATLEHNYWLLDGSFELFPDVINEPIGYYSKELSNLARGFSNSPEISFAFSKPHSSVGITLFFDVAGGGYCSDFTIIWHNEGGVELTRKVVVGNGKTKFFVDSMVERYKKVTIILQKTAVPHQYAKLIEVDFGAEEIYTNEDLISARIMEEIDPISSTITSDVLDIAVNNISGKFNVVNPQGIYSYLQSRQELQVKSFVETKKGRESVPMGCFYLKEWNNPNGIVAKLKAYDVIDILGQTTYIEKLYDNTPLSTAINDLLQHAGVGACVIDANLKSTILNGYLPEDTHREAMHSIAVAVGAMVLVNRAGIIHMKKYCIEEPVDVINYDLLLGKPEINLLPLVNKVKVYWYVTTLVGGNYQHEEHAVIISSGGAANEIGQTAEISSNYLITSENQATQIGNRVLDYYGKRYEQKLNWWADPSIEAGDVVNVQTQYGDLLKTRITKTTFDFNGGTKAKSEGLG